MDATQPGARGGHPSFVSFDIDPELPNVLLIGDSISMGYTVAVREKLAKRANVFRPPINCGPTTRGLELMDQWIADRQWDVIHFNFGLHDLKYMSPGGRGLADPDDPNNRVQVPIEDYAENLRAIARKLSQTGATLIWRETTPVPEGARGRIPGDAVRYNTVAAGVMAEFPHIKIDAFYDAAMRHAEHQIPANVHYTAEGSRLLANHVASVILKTLSD